jgi:hypothetical protein
MERIRLIDSRIESRLLKNLQIGRKYVSELTKINIYMYNLREVCLKETQIPFRVPFNLLAIDQHDRKQTIAGRKKTRE